MPVIEIEEKILAMRPDQKIRPLLKPLVGRSAAPACRRQIVGGTIIFGTYDTAFPAQSSYRDWRFSPSVQGYQCMYFEQWEPTNAGLYFLRQAAFSLYKTDTNLRSSEEIIALHCEPNELVSAPHGQYKRGPHIHVNERLPHAHIGLNCGHLDAVLGSADTLFEAMGLGLELIKDQVLDAKK